MLSFALPSLLAALFGWWQHRRRAANRW
ncbi:hypothetical protein [Moraxella porci]